MYYLSLPFSVLSNNVVKKGENVLPNKKKKIARLFKIKIKSYKNPRTKETKILFFILNRGFNGKKRYSTRVYISFRAIEDSMVIVMPAIVAFMLGAGTEKT